MKIRSIRNTSTVRIQLRERLDVGRAMDMQQALHGWSLSHDESGCREPRLILCGLSAERAAEIVELARAMPVVKDVEVTVRQ